MHVGYGAIFQNPDNKVADHEVWQNEIRFAEMAEPMGFDSIWAVEHHFDDYTMLPDPVQFLTYMAARTKKAKLGTFVIVLPWHDPIRLAEQVSVIDHLSNGRFILGIGRGLARIEYEGFRLDQNEGRNLFVEYTQLLTDALEKGYMEGGAHTKQPRRDIRPLPFKSFKGRTYAAAISPESPPIMAKLGVGLLANAQKPWEAVKKDFDLYREAWREYQGATPPPRPISSAFVFVDENKDRAQEEGMKWLCANYRVVVKHYEMGSPKFGTYKSYESYRMISEHISKNGVDSGAMDYARLMPCGTPAEVIESLAKVKDMIDPEAFVLQFSYGGMPFPEAERNLKCFVRHVLPELKSWKVEEAAEPASLSLRPA